MKTRLALLLAVAALVVSVVGAIGAPAVKNVLILAKPEQVELFKSACKADAGIKITTAITAHPPVEDENLTEKGLAGFDAVILGELVSGEGTNGAKMLTREQMIAVKRRIEAGAGFLMVGGWCSYQGGMEEWSGQWSGTPIADLLPVWISAEWDTNDEPGNVVLDQPEHPTVKGLDWGKPPVFNGHNKVGLKAGAAVVAHLKEDGRPLLVAGTWGKGRVVAYTSSPAGGWDKDTKAWPDYKKLFYQMVLFVIQ